MKLKLTRNCTVPTVAIVLVLLAYLHILNYNILTTRVQPHAEAVAETVEPHVAPSAPAVDITLPKSCQYFQKQAHSPGIRFIGPKGLIENPTKLAKAQSSVPSRITFLHYNQQFKNPRYLCALESAARQNRNHSLIMYARNVSDFLNATKEWRERATETLGPQLTILPLDWAEMFEGTPLQKWWENETYKQSTWVDQNLGNAFRLAVLYKHGGVYLDSDIISLNPLGGMGRSVAMQTGPKLMNNAFFSFGKEDKFVYDMMEEFVAGFNGTVWGRNGPRMVERTYKRHCVAPATTEKFVPAPECDFAIAPPARFFPISFGGRKKVMQPWKESCSLLNSLAKDSIGVHWWNKGMKAQDIKTETVLEVLMKHHCPAVVDVFTPGGLGFFDLKSLKKGEKNTWIGWEENDGF
ncbi:UNVERIFIED_CONTAM: hypothetical protein HDU68_012866 [Siphonaria sp. JEL0065]|nr:hypothetical protein HDU68_012866 [Siphonaria sp. JEL0065]